jgi:hypothetical protein
MSPVKSNGKPRAILVKFATYRARQKIYKMRKELRSKGHNMVFFNEDLTKQRSELLFHARRLTQAGSIDSAWSSDGNVLIKVTRNGSTNIKRISSIDELKQYKSYADVVSFK